MWVAHWKKVYRRNCTFSVFHLISLFFVTFDAVLKRFYAWKKINSDCLRWLHKKLIFLSLQLTYPAAFRYCYINICFLALVLSSLCLYRLLSNIRTSGDQEGQKSDRPELFSKISKILKSSKKKYYSAQWKLALRDCS